MLISDSFFGITDGVHRTQTHFYFYEIMRIVFKTSIDLKCHSLHVTAISEKLIVYQIFLRQTRLLSQTKF